ncbi:unnamed protein product, partial [Didymodactylos carnosus]
FFDELHFASGQRAAMTQLQTHTSPFQFYAANGDDEDDDDNNLQNTQSQ